MLMMTCFIIQFAFGLERPKLVRLLKAMILLTNIAQEVSTQQVKLSHGGGLLSMVLAAVTIDGRRYGIVALAASDGDNSIQPGAEAKSALADAWLYWGCSERKGRGWRPPPHGWHTIPARSQPAGCCRQHGNCY